MAFKTRLRDGLLSYIYHKIAEEGRFVINLPEDFLQHILTPFLSYYMSQIQVTLEDGKLHIKGSSLVPVNVVLKDPIIREEEIVIPFEMNKNLFSFIATFGTERLKPLKIESNLIIIPSHILYDAIKDIAEDLKISGIALLNKKLSIEVISR